MTKHLTLLLLSLLTSTAATLCSARESTHWVCETESLYRAVISVKLYGVGKLPERGCFQLPTDARISLDSCETTDLELCQYHWRQGDQNLSVWGSPIIKHLQLTE